MISRGHEEVLRLDVTVDDVEVVQVGEGTEEGGQDVPHSVLLLDQASIDPQHLVEIAMNSKLLDEVYQLFILKGRVKLDNVIVF